MAIFQYIFFCITANMDTTYTPKVANKISEKMPKILVSFGKNLSF